MADLPEGWAAKTSTSTGRTYYLNEYTKATQWEKPEPVAPGQVQDLLYKISILMQLYNYEQERGIWKFS